jgi:glycosyltransferase involved in cell wall biosynthesis
VKRITAVIPAYNAEKTIAEIVIKSMPFCNEVIVVDDGSKDKTAHVAKLAGARVFKLAKNYGNGFATAFGLNAVWHTKVIVTLDADGQHDPLEIPRVCQPIIMDDADLVIGSRFMAGSETNIRPYRRFGIGVITEFYNFGHVPITDAQCCFRAFRASRMGEIMPMENRFGFSTEMLILARRGKWRILEVPVSCKYRNLKEDSSINPIRHGVSVLLDTIMWRLRLLN